MKSQTYDVVICGGGLAGMCLARQLKLENSAFSIYVTGAFKRRKRISR